MYLQCSVNNAAATVLKCFTSAVESYGLPLRVRSDMGGENVGVAQFMWSQPNSLGTVTVIMGRSVHNQRINACIEMFYLAA